MTNLLEKHAKSFYWASFFLSKKTFNKCSSLYNFCRTLDDIVDNNIKLEDKKENFLKFKKLFINKDLNNPIIKEMWSIIDSENISEQIVMDLFDGVETDLEEIVKINSKKELLVYCYRVAGTVGLMMSKILKVNNREETIKILVKQSLLQAQSGCDVISPSDMMDGRIGIIRKSLDKNNFKDVLILSYSAKYASNFYGPFRDAIGSAKNLKFDKKTYQMDFRNSDEAFREIGLDIKEGADIVMVKPGMPYLDIIKSIKQEFKIPVFAYQVSGEYSLIQNGIEKNLVKKDIIIESLMAFKRAGASAIITYFAIEAAYKIKKIN